MRRLVYEAQNLVSIAKVILAIAEENEPYVKIDPQYVPAYLVDLERLEAQTRIVGILFRARVAEE